MQVKPVTRTIRELIAANHSMSQYLNSLNRGRQATPHSWLYEDEDSKAVLERWLPIMESANNTTPFGELFNNFDRKQIEKFGPQGLIPAISSEQAQSVIEPLFSPSEFDNDRALSKYFRIADEFGKQLFSHCYHRLRPKRFESVTKNMRERGTLVTNSGFPRFARRSVVSTLEVQDAETGRAYDYPAIILFRQYNGKLRPVWMFPMSMNLIEFSFTLPLQDALKSGPQWVRQYLSPWDGFNAVKVTLTKQWENRNVCGGDTTAMDAHMRPAQIRLVYEIVKHAFQPHYHEDLWKTLQHVNNIPLLVSTSEWVSGTHGLASGSGWTQMSETVLQLFMAWVLRVHGQGIGDDFYWLVDMDADELVCYLGKYGLPANAAKQSVSKSHFSFLQRCFAKSFYSKEDDTVLGAYYPTVRALNSLLHPEKYHRPKDWNSDMFCVRNYSILENCIDDPCFEQFVTFVAQGHKDMIAFAKQKATAIDAAQSVARRVPGLNPTYNQEKMDKPLSTFASIQIAKKLK